MSAMPIHSWDSSFDTRPSRIMMWVIASLCLHLLLLILFFLIPKTAWNPPKPLALPLEKAPQITLQFIPEKTASEKPLQKPAFIPTLPSQAVEIENPNARLESDHHTKLRSKEQGLDPSSPLPQQSGSDRAGLSYIQTPASPSQNEKTSPTSIQSPNKPATNPAKSQTEPQKEDMKLGTEGIPLFPTPQLEKPNPQSPSPTQTKTENKPTSSSAPMMFAREKSLIKGAQNAETGNNSPEAKSTDLGRYKSKIFRTIGSRWYLMVDQQMSLLAIGGVKIRFFIQANGVIRDIQIINENGRTDILANISSRSVRDSGPFEPFSDQMKQQLGEGYWEEITFSIY